MQNTVDVSNVTRRSPCIRERVQVDVYGCWWVVSSTYACMDATDRLESAVAYHIDSERSSVEAIHSLLQKSVDNNASCFVHYTSRCSGELT